MFNLLKTVFPPSPLLSKNQLLAKSRSLVKYREILKTSRWAIPSGSCRHAHLILAWSDRRAGAGQCCCSSKRCRYWFHLLKPATNYSRIWQNLFKWFRWFCCLPNDKNNCFVYL